MASSDDITRGVVSYGAYVPRYRLARSAIADALGTAAGPGERSVASYDEDTTSMGVEAARRAIADGNPDSIHFATTAPAYFDKTNASAIHAALGLDRDGFAVDLAGSARSATGAWRAAAAAGGLAVLSDIRGGRPGSADESEGGDGAAAFLFGSGDGVVARILAEESVTSEFLDRWRLPGESASQVWEERFGAGVYLPLIRDVAGRALSAAGVEIADHVIVSSPHSRAARTAIAAFDGGARGPGRDAAPGREAEEAASVGDVQEPRQSVIMEGMRSTIGYAGAADAGLALVEVLDRADPGETILMLNAADGCDATVLQTTDALPSRRAAGNGALSAQLASTRELSYPDFLTWRGALEREPPRRPEPDRPAGPPVTRSESWKFAFVGSRCEDCGQVHLPPRRVCVGCGMVDRMQPSPLADTQATVATYTIDRLAYSPSPPVIDVVVDFDGGGRYTCQATDAAPEEIAIGDRMEMSFRRFYTTGGVHNYFWKARPVLNAADPKEG